jgi:hypothetical protein
MQRYCLPLFRVLMDELPDEIKLRISESVILD